MFNCVGFTPRGHDNRHAIPGLTPARGTAVADLDEAGPVRRPVLDIGDVVETLRGSDWKIARELEPFSSLT
jgi:hypothetical protein